MYRVADEKLFTTIALLFFQKFFPLRRCTVQLPFVFFRLLHDFLNFTVIGNNLTVRQRVFQIGNLIFQIGDCFFQFFNASVAVGLLRSLFRRAVICLRNRFASDVLLRC